MGDDNKQAVIRVDQSPMNARQWCLQLACGHDKWITRARKPTWKMAWCDRCFQARHKIGAPHA